MSAFSPPAILVSLHSRVKMNSASCVLFIAFFKSVNFVVFFFTKVIKRVETGYRLPAPQVCVIILNI